MVIHPKPSIGLHTGSWDRNTLRYVPRTGGSQSRLPITTDRSIPRYHGFVGVDERMSEQMDALPKLYHYLGGRPLIPDGPAGKFVRLMLEQADEALLRTAGAGEEGAAEEGEAAPQEL